jgi:SnoaL-like domain
MADIETTVERWFTALNETDDDRRATIVAEAWAPDGRWVDPPFEGEGHEAINTMVSAIYVQYPEHRFRRASAIDAHHDSLRIGWELVSPDGDVVLQGTDVGVVDGDGRLERVTGFFGSLPE